MVSVYYVEVNSICIILLLIIVQQIRYRGTQLTEAGMIFSRLVWSTITLCLCDIVAGVCREKKFEGVTAVLEVSNLLFFELLVVISYLWMVYVFTKIRRKSDSKKIVFWIQIAPLLLFSVIAAMNPLTHFLFTIDSQNQYARNAGTNLHWAVMWGYLLITTMSVINSYLRESNQLRRREISPLFYFFLGPTVAGVIQMLFYGVTCTQVGITISLILISVTLQANQIDKDALTLLNNRRGLDVYLNEYLAHYSDLTLTLILFDLNNFKQINDEFGHKIGDQALCVAAEALQRICRSFPKHPHLCRYGGDEFVVAVIDQPIESDLRFAEEINKATNEEISGLLKDFESSISFTTSVGMAFKVCKTHKEIDNLVNDADASMYRNKLLMKQGKKAV